MQYRYRVFGKVEQSFILRGAYFAIGSKIDFYILESELSFVKERCKIDSVVDFQKTKEAENSVSGVAESTKINQRAVRNVQPTAKQPPKRQHNKRSGE